MKNYWKDDKEGDTSLSVALRSLRLESLSSDKAPRRLLQEPDLRQRLTRSISCVSILHASDPADLILIGGCHMHLDLPSVDVGNMERGDAAIGQEAPEGPRDQIAPNSPGPRSHACLTLFATVAPPSSTL